MADSHWKDVRRHQQRCRAARAAAALQLLPVLREFCSSHRVEMREIAHGFQFKLREYSISWSPSTNVVSVQYCMPGHGQTVRFTRNGQPGKPRILLALEELCVLVSEQRGA